VYSQYQPRIYRNNTVSDDLVSFRVAFEETDVFICTDSNLSREAGDIIRRLRSDIKKYIRDNPKFYKSLKPVSEDSKAPDIVRTMIGVSKMCSVGPMAAVAGAMAEAIGRQLLQHSSQVIVENGGDIFISSKIKRTIGIYAGEASAFRDKLAIQVAPEDTPCGVCTSSATVGHSLSFGKADAVVVLSPSASIADACATALCNKVKTESDIDRVIEHGKSIKDITGILIIIKNKLGVWGNMKLIDI